jgi:hypothetical protein
MAVFADRINDVLRTELSPIGFELVRSRRWVSGPKSAVRRIFEFQTLKGATYSARWGFSLDFVPIVRGGHLRWKRTSKSAAFDLCIDPVDEFDSVPDSHSLVNIPGYMVSGFEDIVRVVAGTTMRARGDFERVDSLDDLVSIFRQRARMRFERFSLDNYVQTHIAWGLALVAIGKAKEGEAHIRLFCEEYDIAQNDAVLCKAQAEAARYAATPPS